MMWDGRGGGRAQRVGTHHQRGRDGKKFKKGQLGRLAEQSRAEQSRVGAGTAGTAGTGTDMGFDSHAAVLSPPAFRRTYLLTV